MSAAVVGFNTTMNSVEENSTFRPQLTIFEGQINIDFNISITAVNGTAKGQLVKAILYLMLTYLH